MNLGPEDLPSAEVQLMFAGMHVLVVVLTAHMLLGIARTAASACMYRLDDQGLYYALFQGDFWPGKFWRNVRLAKVVRITLMAACILLMGIWLAATLWFMPQFAVFPWLRGTDGGFFSRSVVTMLHLLGMAVIFTFAVRRGLRGAVREMPANRM